MSESVRSAWVGMLLPETRRKTGWWGLGLRVAFTLGAILGASMLLAALLSPELLSGIGEPG